MARAASAEALPPAAETVITFGPVPASTRHVMQANRSKNTKPELLVRSYLRSRGLAGYRLQWKAAAGRPDVAYPGRRVAIFVNGCFWHRCPHCSPSQPKTNVEFWNAKFARNRARDKANADKLVADGWTVVVVWECRLKKKRRPRTMAEIACEVRLSRPVRRAADVRRGRLVVVGNGRSARELACRRVQRLARLRAADAGLAPRSPRTYRPHAGRGGHRGR